MVSRRACRPYRAQYGEPDPDRSTAEPRSPPARPDRLARASRGPPREAFQKAVGLEAVPAGRRASAGGPAAPGPEASLAESTLPAGAVPAPRHCGPEVGQTAGAARHAARARRPAPPTDIRHDAPRPAVHEVRRKPSVSLATMGSTSHGRRVSALTRQTTDVLSCKLVESVMITPGVRPAHVPEVTSPGRVPGGAPLHAGTHMNFQRHRGSFSTRCWNAPFPPCSSRV